MAAGYSSRASGRRSPEFADPGAAAECAPAGDYPFFNDADNGDDAIDEEEERPAVAQSTSWMVRRGGMCSVVPASPVWSAWWCWMLLR
ncbi:MAG: hypothetical protein U0232_22685 [Thermomicrobiales bacterium]